MPSRLKIYVVSRETGRIHSVHGKGSTPEIPAGHKLVTSGRDYAPGAAYWDSSKNQFVEKTDAEVDAEKQSKASQRSGAVQALRVGIAKVNDADTKKALGDLLDFILEGE